MISHEKYYTISRTIRIVLIIIALIATVMVCSHVDLLDFRSLEVYELEAQANENRDRQDFHRGNSPDATPQDKQRQRDAHDRNSDRAGGYESFCRNCE